MSTEPPQTTLLRSALAWLFGQPFNNVLLVALLSTMVGAAYLVRSDVPRLLVQIQAGYEQVAATQARQLQYVTESHERQHDRDGEVIRELLKAHGIHVADDTLRRPLPLLVEPDFTPHTKGPQP